MTTPRALSIFTVAILILAACGPGTEQTVQGEAPASDALSTTNTSTLFESDATPYGRTYSQWAAAWWRWAYAIPTAKDPVGDASGAFCGVNQSGSVFFLAGTWGDVPVTRSCSVSADKALLLPLTNIAWVFTPGDVIDVDNARATLADYVENTTMSLEIDGAAMPNLKAFREKSTRFLATLPADNFYGLAAGTYGPAVDEGYYVILRPLPRGTHTLHFKSVSADGFTVEATYNLSVH